MSNLTPQKAFESKTGEDAYGNDLWGTAGVNPSYVKFLEDDWSAHDKLKQRIQDAPILYTAISSNKDCDVSISQDKFHWLGLKHISGIKAGKTVVLVELEQEEL